MRRDRVGSPKVGARRRTAVARGVILTSALAMLLGCMDRMPVGEGGDDSSSDGTGGLPFGVGGWFGIGGLPWAGGAPGTGGVPNAGGVPAAGGSPVSTGGSPPAAGGWVATTGGVPAAGGSPVSTGGWPSSGGTLWAGGTSGTGGAVQVPPPNCGDYYRDWDEQCDDGNLISGDGCSWLCVPESPFELEPNSSVSSATGPWPGVNYWLGTVTANGDQDFFMVPVPYWSYFTAYTSSTNSLYGCEGDTVLTLYDQYGDQIAENDDSNGVCSYISHGQLEPGIYYLRVREFGNNGASFGYRLDWSIGYPVWK
jgi:cysteine-rich repeat protein